MLIQDVMKPIRKKENAKFAVFVPGEQHILNLNPAEILLLPDEVGVINSNNEITGYIDSETLLYLNQAAKGSILEQIMDKYPEGVIAADVTGRIFYVNDVYPRILGTAKYKVLGKYLQILEPGAAMLQVCATGQAILDKAIYLKALDRHVRVNIYPIYNGSQIVAAVSIFRDDTENKKMSQALSKAQGLADYFREQIQSNDETMSFSVIGKTPIFLKALAQAKIAAKADVPVLITGENGAGKEVLAKMIYSCSNRSDKPLITVNCAAIPEQLLESELFGYEEGSFTGAKRGGKLGKFELAEGGTLFLDEIGDMSLAMQSKILRVMQEKEIEKIGRTHNMPVNVRIITATNRPLDVLMAQGTFRRDLYYRLNVVSIRMPCLRERREDIGFLAHYFLQQCNAKYNKNIILSVDILRFFENYDWPGNVRELQNCIEYAVIMCQEEELRIEYLPVHMIDAPNFGAVAHRSGEANLVTVDSPADLAANNATVAVLAKHPPPAVNTPASRESAECTLRNNVEALQIELQLAEKELIQKALLDCAYNKTIAMKRLGMSRRTFYRKLHQFGLLSGKK